MKFHIKIYYSFFNSKNIDIISILNRANFSQDVLICLRVTLLSPSSILSATNKLEAPNKEILVPGTL